MLGLEPSGVECRAINVAGTESQKGMHLMNIATHIVGVVVEARDGGIGSSCYEIAFPLHDTPQHIVEKREPVAGAMADGIVQELSISARHGHFG
jgi:hypothetical protein